MILGVNLTDQIYLAGDTRVTYINGSKVTHEDNVIKLTGIKDSPEYRLAVVVAGDVELASFLTGRFANDLKEKKFDLDIDSLEVSLGQFFQGCIDQWRRQKIVREGLFAYLLIGAVDFTKQKFPTKEQVSELLSHFNTHATNQKSKRWQIEEALQKDPIMKQLNEKLLQQRGKGILQELTENETPRFHPKIQAVLNDDMISVTGPYYSLLVGCAVDVNKNSVTTEVAQWGQGIVKGGGVTPDALKPDMQAVFEFGTRIRQAEKDNILECAFIGTTILDYAKKNQLPGIGGSVAVCILSRLGLALSGQNFRFDNEKIFAKINGIELPMRYYYQLKGTAGLL